MQSPPFSINIHFSQAAAEYLPRGLATPLSFQSIAVAQQSLVVGDNIRLGDIPNCPWFVVTRRCWDLGSKQAVLTIWLDVSAD